MSTYHCPECGYVLDESRGDPHERIPPGTPLAALPDDWHCPDCGVEHRDDFVPDAPAAA